jgi:phospholipase C
MAVNTRRDFLKKSMLLTGAAGLANVMPPSIQRALAIDPGKGSTYLDAEHVVILMQENRAFDHCFGTLKGVRGYNDPRAVRLADDRLVWFQRDESGTSYSPFRLNIKDTRATWMGSLPHGRASQVDAYNKGQYDQWLTAKKSGHAAYAGMPLTMGYYSREDLPFHYALADAFTVCDQNFCSGMTSTTPNRSYFWTGNIVSQEDGWVKANLANANFSYGSNTWPTFPELLQRHGVDWRFYQNDLYCGGGFTDEERAWLANFGCNVLEFFKAYHVKFSARNVTSLQKQLETLPGEIGELKERSPSTEAAAKKIQRAIAKKEEVLEKVTAELAEFTRENFEKLPPEARDLYHRAFVTNAGDPDYRKLDELLYTDDEGNTRKVVVPKGDTLYQFRRDVREGKLPTVSWLASPKYFSDHPTVPWYGSWYTSEVLDILTSNPEVWRKTIFILTYDENDGYFDHVPPFTVPDPRDPTTGKCSPGIDTEIEYARRENELKRGVSARDAREAPLGLGFRVPMIIASPWSRGGKVCSEVFDHTSTIQFLESFLHEKFKKDIHLDNITRWRRAVAGDLTSAFAPFDGTREKLPLLERNQTIEKIYNAQFKQPPSAFRPLTDQEVKTLSKHPGASRVLTRQEPGVKPACALPYELYVDGGVTAGGKAFSIGFAAGNQVFGKKSAGCPFTLYERRADGTMKVRQYTTLAGDSLEERWDLTEFPRQGYQFRVHGPNGFYRAFRGSASDPLVEVLCRYEGADKGREKMTGDLVVRVKNLETSGSRRIRITDHGYKKENNRSQAVKAGEAAELVVRADLGWYDFTVAVEGDAMLEKRYAGRVETGEPTSTDPLMGGMM